MSATIRTLTFGVTVEDSDHWNPADRAAAEQEDGGTYDDWAVEGLETAMHDAGQAYIAAHRDLFRGDLT